MMIDGRDVMLGDWFLAPAIGQKVKVIAMNEDPIDGHLVFKVIDRQGRISQVDALEPIPINADILKKNKFKIDPIYNLLGNRYAVGIDYDSWITITIYGEPVQGVNILTEIETHSTKDNGTNHVHNCDIENIHELQHAIRICKIDKEIEL